ncbi:zinc finger protein 862-like [Tubulanus polymorphus]|uniref:zinc finger protein 862-like n=1 Tax=Tubulanus polymorphus TaxID=672921 RepID=UPI003DA44CC8
MVSTIYTFVQLASTRLQRFKEIAELLETDVLKFKKLYEIRWLSLGRCLVTIIRNYEPLVVFLSQEAADGDPVAQGLYEQLTSYKYCGLLHLLADVVLVTNHLSKIFQFRDVCFNAVRSALNDAKDTLEGFRNIAWTHLAESLRQYELNGAYKNSVIVMNGRNCGLQQQQRQFENLRNQLITDLINNLNRRFPQVDIIDAMKKSLSTGEQQSDTMGCE